MTVNTDVLVLGGGPGGYVAAIRAAQLGKDVILVEKEKELGGVCLNSGCIPTKALIHASNFVNEFKDMESVGIKVNNYEVDLEKMRSWKNGILKKLDAGIKGLCEKHGVEVINGMGTFVSSNELHISGQSDVTSVKFKKAVIATGSSPYPVPGFPWESKYVKSSTEALEITHVPKKIVVIGGGYIGTEMGTVYGKLGSEVHILEMMPRLLSHLDEEIVNVVAKKLTGFNVHVHVNTKALSLEEHEDHCTVVIEENGEIGRIDCEEVFVVVGRIPNSKNLGLENTNVKIDEKGFITVNTQMITTDPSISAAGDVVGNPMLAHKAFREGKVAAEVACGLPSAFDNKVIPLVVFNDPEIASVGLTKEEAEQKGYDVLAGTFPFSALGRALTLNKTEGFVKTIADKNTGVLLGLHCVGPGASDIISEAALAIELGATLEDMALTIHPHPTLGEALMEAAEAALGKNVNIFTKVKK
ncbi:MAG: dihydrolipoyl dehydrogenase [Candidatus Woesearchaeota archaeon]